MDNMNFKNLLDEFKKDIVKELKECDFSTIYNDYDILETIKAYISLSDLIEKDKTLKTKIEKIEKSALRQVSAIKITNEDGESFYAKRGEAYDSEGNLIEDMYGEYIDNEDLFCNYIGDDIYNLMKKFALSKARHLYGNEY